MKNSLLKILPMFFVTTMSLFSCGEDPGPQIGPIYDEDGNMQVQISSDSCANTNYKDLVKKFKQVGFQNIYVNFLNDIIVGIFATEDTVDTVRINSYTTFEKEDFFSPKSVVFLDVHSKHGGYTGEVHEIDGQLPIFFKCNELKEMDKLEAGQLYKDIGFTNVTYTPIQDCTSTTDWKMNDVENVTVDGSSDYYDYSFFDKNASINISYHTIKGDYCINGLEHTVKQAEAVEPTCTESGWTAGPICTVCGKNLQGRTEIPALGHDKVIDVAAIEECCISAGRTEGSHCARCGEILSVSEPIPINPNKHIHTTVIPGTKATCQSTGICDGLVCDDCGKTLIEQVETPKDPNNHTNVVIDKGYPATETTTGLSDGSHCEDCGVVIKPQEPIYWFPDVDWMCSHNPTAAQIQLFETHYWRKTISFEGWIYRTELSSGSTIFNYYISGGDYPGSSAHNAIFVFKDISQADKRIREILGKGIGTNVRASGKVMDSDSSYVYLDLVEITLR